MAWPTFPIQSSRLVSDFRGDFNDIIESILSAFTGATEPTPKYAGQFWVDTSITPRLLKQRNSTNTAWIIRARVDTDYGGVLPIAGGTMEGGINMGGFPLSNLPLGSGTSPARYVDLAGYVKADGSVPFTGAPSLPGDPTLDAHAARKAYVDARAIAGGTYTGQISLPVAASIAAHALRKGEFDSTIAGHGHTGAAGQGPKVNGENLLFSGSPGVGAHLRASAAGLPGYIRSPYVFDGRDGLTSQSLWSLSAATSYTLVSVSSYVPALARAAILKLLIRLNVGADINLRLRTPGASGSVLYHYDFSISGATGSKSEYYMVIQDLGDARSFEFSIVDDGGVAFLCAGMLIGYL